MIAVGQVCELLKVFKDCTEEISSKKQVSSSKIILLHQSLKKWCTRSINQPDVNRRVEEMVVKLLESLNKCFKATEENKSLADATLLDLWFKCHGFPNSQQFERAKQSLVSHCQKSKDAKPMPAATVPAAPGKVQVPGISLT
jgi:hypothetical protein